MELVVVNAVDDAEGSALFETVARRVYARDDVWAPASEMMWRRRFDQLSDMEGALVRLVVILEDGEPIARCMPMYVPGCVDGGGNPQGWIGFFECLQDCPRAARSLLANCEVLLSDHGVRSVLISKSDNQLAGILTAGFDLPHLVFTNHNPPYYLDLIESCGYEPGPRMVSFVFTRENAGEFDLRLPGLRTREFDRGNLEREIAAIHRLQAGIFGGRPGYVPRTLDEDRRLFQDLLPFIEDELVIFAETDSGDPVGLLVCLPDMYQKMGGAEIDRARIVTIGAMPSHAAKGVGALMGARLMQNLLRNPRYVYVEGSWVRSDNLAPRLLARRFKALPGREFRLLEKRLP